ncbi:urease accessory protein UreE [Methyloterricola oryzae]|uniref:urease accessory protein UreE n=1 Tax=Methyloterricola oryzae TaxID=1495050 RepID=UPI0005EAFDFC|nr:urease accessory protein UreE [Methyloterricola oryzae]
MLELTERAPEGAQANAILTLTFDQRQRSRLRAALDSGADAGVLLPRGSVLRDGDLLQGEGGVVVRIKAAAEVTSVVRTEDPLLFARACYHLGNRHVPLQIGEGELRYLHDHVLDDMLRGMGLAVVRESAPFEPEPGAYASGGATHHHGH